eukprot:766603-Hanusia_phi.AAC.2
MFPLNCCPLTRTPKPLYEALLSSVTRQLMTPPTMSVPMKRFCGRIHPSSVKDPGTSNHVGADVCVDLRGLTYTNPGSGGDVSANAVIQGKADNIGGRSESKAQARRAEAVRSASTSLLAIQVDALLCPSLPPRQRRQRRQRHQPQPRSEHGCRLKYLDIFLTFKPHKN